MMRKGMNSIASGESKIKLQPVKINIQAKYIGCLTNEYGPEDTNLGLSEFTTFTLNNFLTIEIIFTPIKINTIPSIKNQIHKSWK